MTISQHCDELKLMSSFISDLKGRTYSQSDEILLL